MRRYPDNNRFYARLMHLLDHPSEAMVAAGNSEIRSSVEALHVGATAAKDILTAMVAVATVEAERG